MKFGKYPYSSGSSFYHITWRVPDLEGQFCPILGQEKDEFLATTIQTFSDENILNQFYICLCVQVFNQLFCLLFKFSLKYILITNFKNPMMAVYNSKTVNDSCSEQSTSKYMMVVLLLNYFDNQKIL